MIERFVKHHGEKEVVQRKEMVGGEWRFDFNMIGKEQLPIWLEANAKPADLARFIELVNLVRDRMKLPDPIADSDSPAPLEATGAVADASA